jgi:hypothetical protein
LRFFRHVGWAVAILCHSQSNPSNMANKRKNPEPTTNVPCPFEELSEEESQWEYDYPSEKQSKCSLYYGYGVAERLYGDGSLFGWQSPKLLYAFTGNARLFKATAEQWEQACLVKRGMEAGTVMFREISAPIMDSKNAEPVAVLVAERPVKVAGKMRQLVMCDNDF